MHRNKGQFTSSKKQDGSNSWGTDQESGQDDSQSETSWVLFFPIYSYSQKIFFILRLVAFYFTRKMQYETTI